MVLKVVSLLVACMAIAQASVVPAPRGNYIDEKMMAKFEAEGKVPAFAHKASSSRRIEHIVAEHGYPLEEHEVQTADGYLLTVHRIPYGRSGPSDNRKVVFLQHGLLCSAADWVLTGPGHSFAYLLADSNYDVWLGNARGNTYSRKHSYLSPESGAFWDFSWHEIGQFDLPAMIDLVLSRTGESALHYAGHSQGTTSFFIMGSERPEYNAKIKLMHALAPVAFMSNLVSPFIRAFSPFVDAIETLMELLGSYEVMPSSAMMEKGGYYICRDESILQDMCANFLFLIGGWNSNQLNYTHLPEIMAVTPAGASMYQMAHYAQGVNSGKFRMYDHGYVQNMIKYGQLTPPDYQLDRVTCPVALHYSDNDWLAAVSDVNELGSKLNNVIGKFRVSYDRFNHLDFTWAIDGHELLYDRIISLMDRYD